MIKLRNFGIEYDDKKIFNPFDYDFNETGFTILVGPSGCGKSSLLKSLINQNIYSGAIFYNDNNINEMDFSLFFKNNISYISHDDNLFYYNTAKENILLSIHNLNNDLYNYYIDRYNMSSFINKKINELSLGQRQLVLLVSIFLQPKPYIFLDEALCNLDYDNIHLVMEDINKLKANHFIFLITHTTQIIEDYADCILTIKDYSLVEIKKNIINNKLIKPDEYGDFILSPNKIKFIATKKSTLLLRILISLILLAFMIFFNILTTSKNSFIANTIYQQTPIVEYNSDISNSISYIDVEKINNRFSTEYNSTISIGLGYSDQVNHDSVSTELTNIKIIKMTDNLCKTGFLKLNHNEALLPDFLQKSFQENKSIFISSAFGKLYDSDISLKVAGFYKTSYYDIKNNGSISEILNYVENNCYIYIDSTSYENLFYQIKNNLVVPINLNNERYNAYFISNNEYQNINGNNSFKLDYTTLSNNELKVAAVYGKHEDDITYYKNLIAMPTIKFNINSNDYEFDNFQYNKTEINLSFIPNYWTNTDISIKKFSIVIVVTEETLNNIKNQINYSYEDSFDIKFNKIKAIDSFDDAYNLNLDEINFPTKTTLLDKIQIHSILVITFIPLCLVLLIGITLLLLYYKKILNLDLNNYKKTLINKGYSNTLVENFKKYIFIKSFYLLFIFAIIFFIILDLLLYYFNLYSYNVNIISIITSIIFIITTIGYYIFIYFKTNKTSKME